MIKAQTVMEISPKIVLSYWEETEDKRLEKEVTHVKNIRTQILIVSMKRTLL